MLFLSYHLRGGTEENARGLGHDGWSPKRGSNQGTLECEAVISVWPERTSSALCRFNLSSKCSEASRCISHLGSKESNRLREELEELSAECSSGTKFCVSEYTNLVKTLKMLVF